MGLKVGVFGFSPDQNNCDLSGAYVLQSEHEGKHKEMPHGAQRLWTHLFAFVFTCVVGNNRNTPNWSSIADSAITRGGI